MRWSRWVGCWTLSAGLCALSCKPAPDVQILGESTRLARAEPSPKQSPLFDGQVVHLIAVRGETLGLTLRITDERRRDVRLEISGEGIQVNAFAVRSLMVREPSTDMYGPSSGAGEYPDVLVPEAAPVQTSELAYFDVQVSRSAVPGRHRGALYAGERSMPVVLDVARATIDLSDQPLVWAFYLPKEIARAHGLADGDGELLIDKEAEYHRLLRAHGVLLASDLPPERFAARRRFVTKTRYFPVAVDTSTDAAIQRDVARWLELFRTLDATPFAIPVDEPKSRSQKERARHIAEVIGRAGGGRPRLLRAVTDSALPIYGDAFDVYLSPKNIPKVALARRERGERFWTYNGRPPEAGSMILDTSGVALRTWGWIAYRYDIELWYAWEALYYSDRYNRGGKTNVFSDPVTFDERSAGGTDFGNGDGVLVYPGPLPSLRLKALRRGLTDRLLLQRLEACGGGETARAIARRVVPLALGEAGRQASWSTDERVWEQARREVIQAIGEKCDD